MVTLGQLLKHNEAWHANQPYNFRYVSSIDPSSPDAFIGVCDDVVVAMCFYHDDAIILWCPLQDCDGFKVAFTFSYVETADKIIALEERKWFDDPRAPGQRFASFKGKNLLQWHHGAWRAVSYPRVVTPVTIYFSRFQSPFEVTASLAAALSDLAGAMQIAFLDITKDQGDWPF